MNTFRTLFFLCVILLCLPTLQGQNARTTDTPGIGVSTGSGKWMQFNPAQNISVANLWDTYREEMGLSKDDQMMLMKTEADKFGWSHHHFQQVHKGIPVEFALYRVHEKDGRAVKGNGELAKEMEVNVQPTITRDEAFSQALQHIGAQSYYWEIPAMEERKRHATDDPSATFYPEGELLIADVDFDPMTEPQYKLAWRFEVYSYRPESRNWVYVDAQNGTIMKSLNLDMYEGAFQGTASTRYSGVRDIVTDSTEVGYVLRDRTRGRGVETLDAQHEHGVDLAIDFIDDDNTWNNANERADDAATDAHWAAEMYYDYLHDRHGFKSYDNQRSKLICYVHVGQGWYNASWSGFWTNYGDAGGEPWTHIDVVGHEFTHGFTWATAGLIYEGESGALNESFSDIVGEALQRYGTGGTVDWIGTPAPADTLRSYSNPNAFENPDTYHGEFWQFGEEDNFGVHTNSGVQNHWFYLLAEGGIGTNDLGTPFAVESIGFEKAIDIAIRNLSMYLFPKANYADAREGSLQAAEDIFGACSFEYRQVANAWHAVGIGERSDIEDFTVTEVERKELCTVGATAPISMKIKHLGCEATGPIELYVTMTKTNPVTFYMDTLNIEEGFGPGQVIDYVFSKEFDFSRKGEHLLTGKVSSAGDLHVGNDASEPVIVHRLSQVVEEEFPFHARIALRTFRDSMAFIVGTFADLDVLANAGKDSTYGIRIEGSRLWYANPVYRRWNPFLFNPRLGTQTCLCVDGRSVDSLGLQFDLRQTYSTSYENDISGDQAPSCVMRIMVEDEELTRYVPLTQDQDPWSTHYIDLQQFVGTEFTVCFETRTMVSRDYAADNIGDRVYLDNIALVGREVTTSISDEDGHASIIAYPNPVSDEIMLSISSREYSDAEIFLVDLTGRMFKQQRNALLPGFNKIPFSLESIAPGAYFIEVIADGKKSFAKVVVQ